MSTRHTNSHHLPYTALFQPRQTQHAKARRDAELDSRRLGRPTDDHVLTEIPGVMNRDIDFPVHNSWNLGKNMVVGWATQARSKVHTSHIQSPVPRVARLLLA